ncbi:unnamed protein product [Acanthoscelides obtectus]|uniref:Origin recognition complex subunit 1 n=1 Tax=Acanthoscelides obtectus TaxID=200917 RepID=A0A9P0LPI2_ACAOB|nr:unnamed protein product [Acanthoscelides obtectus]CAK1671546.1 Origin recognition complex subunit 1 [Acanthoscelides obtectus]
MAYFFTLYDLNFSHFSSISISDETYTLEDLVLIDDQDGQAVCKILCIYQEKEVLALVKKYIFADRIKNMFYKEGLNFDKENEVVEDLSADYIIDVSDIKEKCALILLHEEEDPHFLSYSSLNPSTTFVCRYSLKSKKLVPVLELVNSPLMNITKSAKRRLQSESTPTSYVDNFKNESTENETLFSPRQRNSVRRNLNKSFGSSPQDNTIKSILEYSVVNSSGDESDIPTVVKLRISRRALRENVRESPKTRKSSRQKPRISYADYMSPIKKTPRKRNKDSTSTDEDRPSAKLVYSPEKSRDSSATNRAVAEIEGTPGRKKKVSSSETPRDCSAVYTPSKGEGVIKMKGTPGRKKSVIQTEKKEITEEMDSVVQTETRKLPKYLEASPVTTNRGRPNKSTYIIEKKDNLDDSLRTSILKVHLKKTNLEDMFNDDRNKSGEEDAETESNAPRTPRSKRKPRRAEDSESESYLPSSPPKTPRTRRSALQRSIEKCFTTRRQQKSVLIKDPVEKTPKAEPKTPRTPRSRTAPNTPNTPKTPRNISKLIKEGIITPSMKERSRIIEGDGTPLMRARSQLHVSYVPKSLPCRENEYEGIYSFLEGKLQDECGGCMYISGVPGTGKTATVTSVINDLQENKKVPSFTFVSINGMRLTEPRQAYVEIYKQLKGKTVPWEQAQSMLDEMFVKSKKMKPIIMLVDELDILCNKRQDVVYNLLDWPTKAKNQLMVVTIANTMDLPERLLMSRVTSRLGLTRLTFQPYTYKQLQEIVTMRLCGTDSFNPDAVQFVARKVASVSGDARRALDICRRATEIAEMEGKGQLVGMNHVNDALNMMITQPRVRAIKSCSRLQQLILQAIVAEMERTGIEETSFNDVFKMLMSCCAIDGFQRVSITIALSAVAKLSACRLILTDPKCCDIYQRIILNVSADDVYYALKND